MERKLHRLAVDVDYETREQVLTIALKMYPCRMYSIHEKVTQFGVRKHTVYYNLTPQEYINVLTEIVDKL